MRKYFVVVWVILGGLLGVTSESIAENKISLATLEWAPYVGETLDQYGFTSEIVTEAFKRAGYTVEITFMPWARVLYEVENGKFDAGYPGYYSEERAKIYALSESFAKGPLGFYQQKGANISYKTLQDLKPYTIGVVRGYVNRPDFDAADYLKKEVADSDEQNLRKLLKGRLNLVVIDKLTAQHLLNTLIPEGIDKLEFVEPPLEEKPLFVMFSRQIEGYEQKLNDFNAALQQMSEDGTIQAIMQRHGFE